MIYLLKSNQVILTSKLRFVTIPFIMEALRVVDQQPDGTVKAVDAFMALARENLFKRFPNMVALILRDPSDKRYWFIQLGDGGEIRKPEDLKFVRMSTLGKGAQTETFNVGVIEHEEKPPVLVAGHLGGIDETTEQVAIGADARLRSILGIPAE
jgi:hypothetical protein